MSVQSDEASTEEKAVLNQKEQADKTDNSNAASQNKKTLMQEIFSKKMGICIVLGFSSGLPLYVLLSLLTAWLRKLGIDLKVIGILSLIMIPYTWKFVWSPILDRYSILGFARRKGWILLTQVLLIVFIGIMGYINPKLSMPAVSALALLIAFASATQDIAIDAYRRELLSDNELGLGNSLFVNAYRIAGLIPAGVSLILADIFPWSVVYIFTAACLIPGFCISLCLKERSVVKAPRNLKSAVIEPWREFISRHGIASAALTILFVFLYKLGDSMCTALATPFYIDLGYDLTTIGIVAKNVGLWSTVLGGTVGGIWMIKLGINKALWIFGFCQMIAIVGFALIAKAGETEVPSIWYLAIVIGLEALGTGLGTAAFVSFIAAKTNPAYTATQFALLTSLSAVPRTFCNATTGFIVDAVGWVNFYYLCVALAVPGMLLLFKVAPWNSSSIEKFE